MEPELICVTEAARVIGIGRTQLYKLLSAGQIASVKVGKIRLIPARALRQWVDDLVAAQAEGYEPQDSGLLARRHISDDANALSRTRGAVPIGQSGRSR